MSRVLVPSLDLDKMEEEKKRGLSRAAKKRAKKKQKKSSIGAIATKEDDAEVNDLPLPLPHRDSGIQSNTLDDVEPDEDDNHLVDQHLDGDDKLSELPSIRSYKMITDLLSASDESSSPLTSRQRARLVLQFLLADVSVEDFYARYWEKQPLCIRHENGNEKSSRKDHQNRLLGLLSKKSIRETLKDKPVYYGRDLNVTRYEKGRDGVKRRVTLDMIKSRSNPDEDFDPNDLDNYVKVDTESLWTNFQQGCTVRLLCPHKNADTIHSLLSLLELEWGCMVGANAYLTPPSQSQGFAPHYDDIEAFCLQLEGRKRWKVYEPINKAERLPRVSSEDYTEEDLRDVEPVLDVVLEPGDMLYMPRGWIHQACTLPSGSTEKDGHSLHLTVSAMQQWAWVDLLELLLPSALASAAASESSTSLREGLPRGFLDYMGAMHQNSDDNVPEVLRAAAAKVEDQSEKGKAKRVEALQKSFRNETKSRIMKVAKEAMKMLDATCDEFGKRFLSERLPPAFTDNEKADMQDEDIKILPNHLCRLARPGIARMVLEDNKAVLYHCVENSRVYHEKPLSPMEFELDDAPAIEQLLTTAEPHWICVVDLIHDSIEDKVGVAQALYDEGILALRPSD